MKELEELKMEFASTIIELENYVPTLELENLHLYINSLIGMIKDTPPTAEDVCKVLVKNVESITEVKYFLNKEYNKIVFVIYEDTWGSYLSDWTITSLPPHLITLIGRFYEGVDSND